MNVRPKGATAIIVLICLALILGLIINLTITLFERAAYPRAYREAVERYSREFCVPEAIVYSVIRTESNFDPNAVSTAGAKGLMQLLPDTFMWLTGDAHLAEHLSPSDIFEPEINIKYGIYYLKYLHAKFGQNWDTALAAYNGGEGNVTRWLSDERFSDGEGNIISFPGNFTETENYVKKVNQALAKYENLYYR